MPIDHGKSHKSEVPQPTKLFGPVPIGPVATVKSLMQLLSVRRGARDGVLMLTRLVPAS